MAFITVNEILNMIILALALGFIFSKFLPVNRDPYKPRKFFDWEAIKFAAIIATPAVVFHELGHKFIALSFGLDATFFIWGTGLLIGIVLAALNSPFLFLAPAYVSISGAALPYQTALIAFAGPGLNLFLWGISAYVLKAKKQLKEKERLGWAVSKKLNLFLFFFNLIPIPPLDGYSVLTGFLGMF
tara:strand:- start:1051 stop:1608 length:558 start_codon:yes stop_codon:yes gene_type:complete